MQIRYSGCSALRRRESALAPASRIAFSSPPVVSAMPGAGDADAARERRRRCVDGDEDVARGNGVLLGGAPSNQERSERQRHLVGESRHQTAEADAVQNAFGLFEYPDSHRAEG